MYEADFFECLHCKSRMERDYSNKGDFLNMGILVCLIIQKRKMYYCVRILL